MIRRALFCTLSKALQRYCGVPWCSKTMKQRPCPCWRSKPFTWVLSSFLRYSLPFVLIHLYRCLPLERKRDIPTASFLYHYDVTTHMTKLKLFEQSFPEIFSNFINSNPLGRDQKWSFCLVLSVWSLVVICSTS